MKTPLLTTDEIALQLSSLNEGLDIKWKNPDYWICKTFVFRNFVDAFGFMTKTAIAAEKINHHPDWSNVYKTVEVKLSTHESGGITRLDFELAKIMEDFAAN